MDIFDIKKGLIIGGIAGLAAAVFCFALGCWTAGLAPSGTASSGWSGMKLALAGFAFFGPTIGLVAAVRPEYRKRPGKRG